MPYEINDTFRDEKNKQENRPIMLYVVNVNGVPTLRLAEYDVDVEYPSGGGTNYLKAPITHEGVSMSATGEIDAVKLKVSNVSREIWATVMAYNGLRGEQVTMRLVFADHLDDADAHRDWVYYIDAPSYDEEKEEASFLLTSKMDLHEVQLPGRIFERDYCQWTYKKEGCWRWNGSAWEPRSGFTNEATECDHIRNGPAGCKFHTNSHWFGAFPGIPARGIYVV
jgi:lambda family phage minor tail protein L